MILHIHDSQSVFISSAQYCFLEAGLKGEHIVVGEKLKQTHSGSNLTAYEYNSNEYRAFLKNRLSGFSLVFFHGLLNCNEKVIGDVLKISSHPPVAWMLFGAEIQNSFVFPSAFLGRRTRLLYYTLIPYRIFIPIFRLIKIFSGNGLIRKLKKIDYFAHFIPQEMEFVFQHTGVRKPMLWHTYAILDHYIEPSVSHLSVQGSRNIMIGNSASFTSNHLEVFDLLNKIETADRKIIVPLSYGNKKYRKYLVRKGQQYFGDNYLPLTEFMEKEQYHQLLLGCSVMILNHYRQQALGNILFGAWSGMRVYVRKHTSTFSFFREKGLNIFSIEDDLNSKNPLVFAPLNEQEIRTNRLVLEQIFGREHVISRFKESFKSFQEAE